MPRFDKNEDREMIPPVMNWGEDSSPVENHEGEQPELVYNGSGEDSEMVPPVMNWSAIVANRTARQHPCGCPDTRNATRGPVAFADEDREMIPPSMRW